MADLINKYPLDLTGLSTNNLVQPETHVLEAGVNRTLVPKYGAFYTANNLTVVDVDSGLTLTPTAQYIPIMYWAEPSERSGLEICCGIVITDEAVSSNIEIGYQVVGGDYANISAVLIDLLATLDIDAREVAWGDLLDVPSFFPSAAHLHALGDIYGFEQVVAALDQLRDTIANGDSDAMAELRQMIIAVSVNIKNKQPLDDTLTGIAALTVAADKMVYSTAEDEFAVTTLTAFMRTLLDDDDAVTARSTLGIASPLGYMGNLAAHRNLSITTNAANPTDTLDVSADALLLRNVSGVVKEYNNLSDIVNIAASGIGGLDINVAANSTWYHIWAIGTEAGDIKLIFSLSTILSGLTFPDTYTYAGYLGAAYKDSVGNLRKFEQIDTIVKYAAITPIIHFISDGVKWIWTALPITTIYPPTATKIHGIATNEGGGRVAISPYSDGRAGDYAAGGASTSTDWDLVDKDLISIDAMNVISNFEIIYKSTIYYWTDSSNISHYAHGWEY